jgi:hypothetical protein
MVARGEGHVITSGSVAADYPYPGGSTYAGSKAFVKQFALALRSDLQGKNVRVTNIAAGTARGSTTFVFEWDQARNATTKTPYTTYQIGKSCAYTFSGSDKAVGGNSGLTLMTGPGPHYKLSARCTCDRGVAYAMVRVYEGKAAWMGPQNLTASLMKTPLAFYSTCSPVR